VVGHGIGKWASKATPDAAEMIAANTEKTLGIPMRRMSNIVGNNIKEGLGDINNTIQKTVMPDGSPLLSLSDSAMRRSDKITKAVDMYGKQLGDVAKAVKSDIPATDLMQGIEDIKTTASGLKTHSEALDYLSDLIAENADKNANIGFDKLRDLTREAWDKIQFDPVTGNVAPESRKSMQAWKLLREKQNEIIKQVRPDLYPKFVEANDHYSNLVGLQKAAASVGLKEAAKQSNLLGILNPLTLLSKAGKAIGSVTGADKFINNLPMKLNPAIAATKWDYFYQQLNLFYIIF
jgi:hypothetical protein